MPPQPKDQLCSLCYKSFSKSGIANHVKSCTIKCADALRDAAHHARPAPPSCKTLRLSSFCKVLTVYSYKGSQPSTENVSRTVTRADRVVSAETSGNFVVSDYHVVEVDTASLPAPDESNSQEPLDDDWQTCHDDIRTEYHPRSGRSTKTARFQDYGQEVHNKPEQLQNTRPWHPYRSRLDFDLSELMMEAALNHNQTARLISLIQRAQSSNNQDSFTIQSYSDLANIRTLAGEQYVDVSAFKHDRFSPLLTSTSSKSAQSLFFTINKNENMTSMSDHL